MKKYVKSSTINDVNIDMWYGDNVDDINSIDVTFYPNSGEYRGNLFIDGKYVGDYATKDSLLLSKTFPQFDWDRIWDGDSEDIESSTSIKASESVLYEDDYCRITDFGNGQAEYFDDRTNFYLPVDWANKIADTIKSGKTDRAANMIERAEKKFYEDKRAGKEQKWVRTELNNEDADQMKYYLKKKGIYYEASLMDDGWIHFEVKATDDEIADLNKFIDTL